MLFIEVIILIIFFSAVINLITYNRNSYHDDTRKMIEIPITEWIFKFLWIGIPFLSSIVFIIYGMWTEYYVYSIIYFIFIILRFAFGGLTMFIESVKDKRKGPDITKKDLIRMRIWRSVGNILIFGYPVYQIIFN